MTHLEKVLDPDTFSLTERAVRLSSEHSWTKIMANGTRHQLSPEFAHVRGSRENRLKHVKARLKQHFNIVLNLQQVSDLTKRWEDLPPIRINADTVMRRVTYNGHQIEAIYERRETGAVEICTVIPVGGYDKEHANHD